MPSILLLLGFGFEAGLLEATLLGVIMANQKVVSVRRIVEFKEGLRVLLISLLFIVLSARLEPEASEVMLAPGPLLFLDALILVVRPLAVAASSVGTGLDWKEQAFLAWIAPARDRGGGRRQPVLVPP